MLSEDEVMERLMQQEHELRDLPQDIHWFCPKQNANDYHNYEEPDKDDEAEVDVTPMTSAEKKIIIEDTKERSKLAYAASLVAGLGEETAPEFLEYYTTKLNNQFKVCDACVRHWHMGRRRYLKDLAEEFPDEIVASMHERLNTLDFLRINAGLSFSKGLLSSVDVSQRTQKFLINSGDQGGLIALYEALCSADYHGDEENLEKGDFNYVFTEIQHKKSLSLADVLPATARFLFHDDLVRSRFAANSWEKIKTFLTAEHFDWVVHDVLGKAIVKAAQPNQDWSIIKRFWTGFLLILARMDGPLITHSLRAIQVQPDIYYLGLQHLELDSKEIAQLVINAFSQLLEKSPKDFWSALGTIRPVTVVERIFDSKGFGKLLAETSLENYNTDISNPTLSWIPTFIQSLEPIHRHDACRCLLSNLLELCQGEKYPENARLACCRAGLDTMRVTLSTFTSSQYVVNPSTSLLVINDIMGLINKYKGVVIGCSDLGPSDTPELKILGLEVVREALTLDCKAISAEFIALSNETPIQRCSRTYSQSVWQAVLDIFRPGNKDLAKNILKATSSLAGLDILMPKNKKTPSLPKDHTQYNKDLGQLMDNVSRIFDRLSDFSASDLHPLILVPETARPLFAALLSANQSVFEATVQVIKSLSGELSKSAAIEFLLRDSLAPVLGAMTWAVAKVSKLRTFYPIPYLLKAGGEFLNALCGSTGRLRSKTLTSGERLAVLNWWRCQWKVLDTIFKMTESWAPRVDRPTVWMQDFCRDAMEYAGKLFDAYTVFASAITDPAIEGDFASSKFGSPKEKVLEVVCSHVNGLTMMLRLRDPYLISVITNLLGSLLRCLGDSNLEIDDESADFIKSACKRENQRDFKKTNMTNQQKAELQRALDEHQGVEIVDITPSIVSVKKQSTIDGWSRSADGKRHEPKLPMGTPALNLTSQTEKSRALFSAMQRSQPVAAPAQDMTAFKERRRRAEEEKRLTKARVAAAMRASSGVKGEGSGLKDIGGIVGKDHAPIRSEIMVGSSDEDSDDDDDDDDESGALVKARKLGSKAVADYEESRRAALKKMQQGPVRKTKIQRSAKDLRARVEPNMDKLYVEILEWDLFHEGDKPPTSQEYRKIADSFIDLDLYKRTFAPLLISEVWKSLVAAKEENNSVSKPIEITIENQMSVDKFKEVSAKMPMTFNRDMKLTERDIVLLSKHHDPMNNPSAPHCLARVDRTNRKKEIIEVTLKVSLNINFELMKSFFKDAKIYAVKVADMNTTQREYAALSSLEYYDLCNEVLEAKPSPLQNYTDEKINGLISKYNLNRGQSKAILSANDNDGFTLIQGPPGSGKTKTIVAMVGALLTKTLQEQNSQPRVAPPMPGRTALPTPPPGFKKKLLICAPSNAAVDELVLRLKEGIQPLTGPRQKINVIRIGRSEAINASVKDVMLDELVRKKLEGDNGENNKLMQDRDNLHKEAGQIKEQIAAIRPQMTAATEKGDKTLQLQIQRKWDELKRKQSHIGNKIDEDKTNGNSFSRQNEINRRRYQQEIINGAHVLCATLSGSGHDMFKNLEVEFETVIIDEAAQCIELSALIPLKYGCSKCILVGDPEQLPPTVLSRSAQSFGYEQSLFVRMQKNHPKDVHLLDTQYRMHPDISSFPSKQFYKGRLVDGDGMAKLRRQEWHASTILGPYRFFDVEGVQTKEARGHSFINVPELNAAMRLYQRLKSDYGNVDFAGKIGIITTYKAQLNALKDRFSREYGDAIFDEIEFNTTDAFQGREREIIIFSCVRAKATGGIGFLGDIRRMNVGLTRAKSSLWVLGDSRSLQQGEFWNKLIEDAKVRNKYSGGDVMSLLSRPTSRQQHPPPSPITDGSSAIGAISNGEKKTDASSSGADRDIIMTDAPTRSESRKSSSSNDNDKGAGSTSANGQPAKKVKKKDPMNLLGIGINSHGKRRRDSIKDEDAPSKKAVPPPKNDKVPDLDAALRAHEAKKAAPKPPRPMGVAPPRVKKPTTDPFIQRKPPKRG